MLNLDQGEPFDCGLVCVADFTTTDVVSVRCKTVTGIADQLESSVLRVRRAVHGQSNAKPRGVLEESHSFACVGSGAGVFCRR